MGASTERRGRTIPTNDYLLMEERVSLPIPVSGGTQRREKWKIPSPHQPGNNPDKKTREI